VTQRIVSCGEIFSMISSNNGIDITAFGFLSVDTGQKLQLQLQCAVTSICAEVR
jgi:hypothetical protein